MQEHGMTDDEIDLFLNPYLRADGKIEYQRLLKDTFPGSYTKQFLEMLDAGASSEGRISVPKIGGKPDRVTYDMNVTDVRLLEHHIYVRDNLQAAVRNWDPDAIKDAIEEAVGVLPRPVIQACTARMDRLNQKRKDCAEAFSRGTVSVNERRHIVSILKPIEFATRQFPDDSADFEPAKKGEALQTIKDIAVCLKAYMEPMVVEGHTGNTDPPEYWTSLATNRANLICGCLVDEGVPKDLLFPTGVAGGGSNVEIYPHVPQRTNNSAALNAALQL
jgi:outer membrane protein OmpA-like peptidoglycan-associated protein